MPPCLSSFRDGIHIGHRQSAIGSLSLSRKEKQYMEKQTGTRISGTRALPCTTQTASHAVLHVCSAGGTTTPFQAKMFNPPENQLGYEGLYLPIWIFHLCLRVFSCGRRASAAAAPAAAAVAAAASAAAAAAVASLSVLP
jgi:hypothetical protein